MRTLALLVSLALATTACAGLDPAAALDGRAFLSTSVTDGGTERPLEPGTRIRLGFDAGRLVASAGCNTMSGPFAIDQGRLLVGDLAVTEMGCDPALHDQDMWLARLLLSGPAVVLAGEALTLEAGSTVVGLLDREAAEPDLALEGTRWTLESIQTGDAVSTVPLGVEVTLRIEDGRADFTTGCNAGTGSISFDADSLRITDIAVTDAACAGAAQGVQDAVLAVLGSGLVAYEIEAAALSLVAGGLGLGYRGS